MRLLILFLLFSSTSIVNSQESNIIAPSNERGLITTIRIFISDQITGNCWTNAEHVKNMAHLAFERNGIRVSSSTWGNFGQYPHFRRIDIQAIGYRTNNGLCIADLAILSSALTNQELKGSDGQITVGFFAREYILNTVLSGPQNLDNRLKNAVEEGITEYIKEIYEARNNPLVKQVLKEKESADKKTSEFLKQFLKK